MTSKILSLSAGANYYLYRKPVKMSRSFDSLAATIRCELEKDIITGDIFIFLNKNRSMIKILVYESGGFNIFYRRLDDGSFQLPLMNADENISWKMNVDQMLTMLSGMSLESGGTVKVPRHIPLHGAM